MPTSMVTAPDGKKYRVTHPEGASRDEILSRIQGISAPVAEKTQEPPVTRESLASGNTLQVGFPGLTPTYDTGVNIPQWGTELLSGMGRRFSEIGSLGTHEADPTASRFLDQSGAASIGGVGADIASLLAGGYALRGAGVAGRALFAPTTMAEAVGGGAAYGALTSDDRIGGAVAGGLGGGIGQGAANLLGKAVAPRVDDAARSLLDAGGTVTPGEMLGGMAKRAEDAATSVPILGDAIKGAQKRSLEGYNRKVINEALEPIGRSLPDNVSVGRDAIGEAQNAISKEYDDILTDMPVRMDDEFMGEIGQLREMVKQLPEREQRKFNSVLDEKVLGPFENPNELLLGETFKEVDSGLRQIYKKAQKSGDLYQNDLGDALKAAHTSLMNMAKRQNPDKAARLAQADKAYARMSRVDEAANYSGAQDGIFTPSHLLNSVKKNTSTRQYAKGGGFGQADAEASKGMLAQTIPDSGTTTRALINAATLGGGFVMSPGLLGGLLGGAALYTRPGARLMQGAIADRPAYAGPLRQQIEELAPFAGILGTGVGVNAQ